MLSETAIRIIIHGSIVTVDDYVDYDSDYEIKADPDRAVTDVDPYSGAVHSCRLLHKCLIYK
jgi:hypothetical protein